jgi:hypothetical protein
MELQEKISQATRLLDQGKSDEAIDVLRIDESPKEPPCSRFCPCLPSAAMCGVTFQ